MPSPGVIPSVRPTVPTAEALSNRHVSSGSFSTALMTIPPERNRVIYSRNTVTAFFTVSSAMRRPKKRPFSCRWKIAAAQATSTASVVVFMPPAVEPGEPPTSIRSPVSSRPFSLRRFRSSVLKPAVRGVTA